MFVLLFLIYITNALETFQEYKQLFNKRYSPKEDILRSEIYSRNINKIINQNTKWKQGINQFTDMTDKEFRSLLRTVPSNPNDNYYDLNVIISDNVDWRNRNIM